MRLDEAIVKHLNAAERAALAAELGVDWAELPGKTIRARAAALVTTVGRAGRAADLLAALAQRRARVSWAELPYPSDTLTHLHAELTRRHNLDGLRSLCFRLGLDFDDLPGEGKSGRARELVLALDRLGRAAELWGSDERRVTNDELRKWRVASSGWRVKNGSSAIRRLSSAVSGHLSAVGARLSSALRLFIRHSSFVIRHSAVIRHFSISILLLLALALGVRALARDPAPTTALSKDRATRDAAVARAAGWPPSADPLPADFSLTPPLPVAAAGDSAATGDATPTPPPTDPPTPIAGELPAVIVGERGANLRRGPGPQYDVVATLRAGVVLPAHGVNPSGEWIQVRLPGKGWPWIDVRYAALPQGLELPVITQFAWAVTVVPVSSSVAAPPSPTPVPTTGPVAGSPTPPPHHGPLPTPLPSPTPPRATPPPNYWPTPTSPPP